MSLKRMISAFILATVCICSMANMNAMGKWFNKETTACGECKGKCTKRCCVTCHKHKNRCVCPKGKQKRKDKHHRRRHRERKHRDHKHNKTQHQGKKRMQKKHHKNRLQMNEK